MSNLKEALQRVNASGSPKIKEDPDYFEYLDKMKVALN